MWLHFMRATAAYAFLIFALAAPSALAQRATLKETPKPAVPGLWITLPRIQEGRGAVDDIYPIAFQHDGAAAETDMQPWDGAGSSIDFYYRLDACTNS